MEIATSRSGRLSLTVFFCLLVGFLYLPIAFLALFSFNDGDPSFPLSGFTTHWYGDVLSNRVLMGSLGRSASVAAAKTQGRTVWTRRRGASQTPIASRATAGRAEARRLGRQSQRNGASDAPSSVPSALAANP